MRWWSRRFEIDPFAWPLTSRCAPWQEFQIVMHLINVPQMSQYLVLLWFCMWQMCLLYWNWLVPFIIFRCWVYLFFILILGQAWWCSGLTHNSMFRDYSCWESGEHMIRYKTWVKCMESILHSVLFLHLLELFEIPGYEYLMSGNFLALVQLSKLFYGRVWTNQLVFSQYLQRCWYLATM